MEQSAHILVVDDHREIRDPLAKYLEKHGMRTSVAGDARQARELLAKSAIDLAVLDIMMPGEDGLSLCRHLRDHTDVAIILLTAMTDDADRVIGLELGADDYVTKPFNPRELLARVKAVLRRTERSTRRQPIDSKRLAFDRWTFDIDRREVVDEHGIAIPLSGTEFRLLSAFVQRPNMVLTRDQLLDLSSGRAAAPFDRAIDNQVSRLRRKLEVDAKDPKLIKTVWGDGYTLACKVREIA